MPQQRPQQRSHQWRGVIEEYRDRLPVSTDTPVVTLGEGGTPLVAAQWLSEKTNCEQPDRLVQGPRHDRGDLAGRAGR